MRRTLDDALADGRGVERSFNCHVHDDSSASASVNVSLGVWYCYACGARGTVDGYTPDPSVTLSLLTDDSGVHRYAEEWLDLFDAHHGSPYWTSRFGVETAAHFRCGQHPLTAEPTYPVRDLQGRVLGVVTRTDGQPKYRYPGGLAVSGTFYSTLNRLERVRVAVLVEGAADAMALHQTGMPKGWAAFGCFGAGLHAPQVAALESIGPRIVVAAFDADDAGRAAIRRAECQTKDIGSFVSLDWSQATPADNKVQPKDPGEVHVKERIEFIANAIHHAEPGETNGRKSHRGAAALQGDQGSD